MEVFIFTFVIQIDDDLCLTAQYVCQTDKILFPWNSVWIET